MVSIVEKTKCYHCGDECAHEDIVIAEKHFCCEGCKLVFEILDTNGLCTYYNLEKNPGIKIKNAHLGKYAYLDDETVVAKLIQFKDTSIVRVIFKLPTIHCASCIWLLENLPRLHNGVKYTCVNFVKKEITITYQHQLMSLRQLVELLASIGYEPQITLDKQKPHANNSTMIYRIGVAGFCFGNIMLLSFPEYLSGGSYIGASYKQFFNYLNFMLALPVFFFSSTIYFRSAWVSLRRIQLNLDVPLALGILVLFIRSAFEIISKTGSGYMDSLAGLVFFLLLGRWFQGRVYDRLSFERDYVSYFPIAVTKLVQGIEKMVTLDKLEQQDIILVRNNELIPADATLLTGKANIDYSFVTGESAPVEISEGERIYAGGRQQGSTIQLQLAKKVSQSYLTSLWNNEAFKKEREGITSFANTVSHYFTPAILLLAIGTLVYWSFYSFHTGINAFTAILIVACPCALALSSPFTLGNAMRLLGRNRFYLKDTSVVESLAKIDHLVFDKTGTITQAEEKTITYNGNKLTNDEEALIASLTRHSNHPLSRQLSNYLSTTNVLDTKHLVETSGKGISGVVANQVVKVGSSVFVNGTADKTEQLDTKVWVSINNVAKGYFTFINCYRVGLNYIISDLKPKYKLSLLSGDSAGEEQRLKTIFGASTPLFFKQSPQQKLDYIKHLQTNDSKVMMLGDGLNDAGALRQSNVGVAVSEDVNNFSPACDAILDAASFNQLPSILAFCRATRKVLFFGLGISAGYNAVGLYFAIQGQLSPVIAAIIMPLSSITVIAYGTIATQWLASKYGLHKTSKPINNSNMIINQLEVQLT